MKKKAILLLVVAIILPVSLFFCLSSKPKSLNPNGDSELALLMRSMHEEGMRTKEQLLKGEKTKLKVDYHKLFSAKPTEPAKVANPLYAGFASACETSANSFDRGFDLDRGESYQNMVNACINCHKEICPGPIVKIKKMYLSEKEMASLVREGE